MEEDRAQVDLELAVGVEERLEEEKEEEAQRQPKRRFVGRNQAAEAARKNGASAPVEESDAIQGRLPGKAFQPKLMIVFSCEAKTNTPNLESGPSRDLERSGY
jgi:2-(3-amino-3-carboxypropyl)histidine synthase